MRRPGQEKQYAFEIAIAPGALLLFNCSLYRGGFGKSAPPPPPRVAPHRNIAPRNWLTHDAHQISCRAYNAGDRLGVIAIVLRHFWLPSCWRQNEDKKAGTARARLLFVRYAGTVGRVAYHICIARLSTLVWSTAFPGAARASVVVCNATN